MRVCFKQENISQIIPENHPLIPKTVYGGISLEDFIFKSGKLSPNFQEKLKLLMKIFEDFRKKISNRKLEHTLL